MCLAFSTHRGDAFADVSLSTRRGDAVTEVSLYTHRGDMLLLVFLCLCVVRFVPCVDATFLLVCLPTSFFSSCGQRWSIDNMRTNTQQSLAYDSAGGAVTSLQHYNVPWLCMYRGDVSLSC